MKKILIALMALTLIATGCKKQDAPEISLSISGAPGSAMLVGEKISLILNCSSETVDLKTAQWSSSNPAVAMVNADGRVLAVGMGVCEITASIGEASATASLSVDERDPSKDVMGHVGDPKTTQGRDNGTTDFSLGESGLDGELWYQGGNNSVTYYNNGTFKASWSGTNDFLAGVGFDYGSPGVDPKDGEYNCYFKHNKSGSGGGYNYICIHGWMLNPLVEFYIIEDWFNKPGANLLGQRKGEATVDGDTYEIWQNTRIQQPSIIGTQTFAQYFSVRKSARSCGRVHVSTHFNHWERLGMKMGKLHDVRYFVEVGGGSGSVDCTYLFMSDGQI